jgi:BirA family biotin operon repressor/biotin-[acetyl-CoA-carboxylase] ligase
MTDFRLRRFDTVASTNDEAKQAAAAGEPEGLVIQALRQTAGRGRQDRAWESPSGNLYVSILLRPTLPMRDIGQFSFLAALAIYDTIRAHLPAASLTLKWPNDVLAQGKKISGILIEAGEGWLVIGIGLNIAHYPKNTIWPAISLHALGAKPDLSAVLNQTLADLDHWYDTLQRQDFAPLRAAWLERAQTGPLGVRLPEGDINGNFAGIDENGRLRLVLADGSERVIATGDVFLRPKEAHAARD